MLKSSKLPVGAIEPYTAMQDQAADSSTGADERLLPMPRVIYWLDGTRVVRIPSSSDAMIATRAPCRAKGSSGH